MPERKIEPLHQVKIRRDMRASQHDTGQARVVRERSFAYCYQARAESYHGAVKFALGNDSAVPVPEELKTKAELHTYFKSLIKFLEAQPNTPKGTGKETLAQLEGIYVMQQQAGGSLSTISELPGTGDAGQSGQIERASLACDTYVSSGLVDEYVKIFNANKKQHPKWFSALPTLSQTALKKAIRGDITDDISADNLRPSLPHKLSRIPCILRGIPGVANHGRHVVVMRDGQGEVQRQSHRIRSSVLSPLDIKDKTERARICQLNVETLIDSHLERAVTDYVKRWGIQGDSEIKLPILLQTLLSAKVTDAFIGDNEADMVRQVRQAAVAYMGKHPHGFKMQVKGRFYTVKPTIFCPRHGINGFSRRTTVGQLLSTADGRLPKEELALSDMVAERLGGNLDKNPLLSAAKKAYDDIRSGEQSVKSADWNQPMLLAALENIMVADMGGMAHSSCKSGKDREGMLVEFTDALLIFFQEKGQLPDFSHTDDANRCHEIFVKLLKTGHQQALANLNSPGANGLKSIKKVLPKRLLEKLGKAYLKEEKELSSLNKPKKKPGVGQKVLLVSTVIVLSPVLAVLALVFIPSVIFYRAVITAPQAVSQVSAVGNLSIGAIPDLFPPSSRDLSSPAAPSERSPQFGLSAALNPEVEPTADPLDVSDSVGPR